MDLEWKIQANSPYNDGWTRKFYQDLIDAEHKDSKEGDKRKESSETT